MLQYLYFLLTFLPIGVEKGVMYGPPKYLAHLVIFLCFGTEVSVPDKTLLLT